MNKRISDSSLMNEVFLNRWSPRSFSNRPVAEEQLAAIFEAARWAPSCYNEQPWYYVYETDGENRQDILNIFTERNRQWAQRAPVVGLVIARTTLEGGSGRTRDFDVGSATMAMLIQATMFGLYAHLMGGIHVDDAHELLDINPEEAKIICGFVIGHLGNPTTLPEPLQKMEQPNTRKAASEFAFKGTTVNFTDSS
ncbi:MAG: nitroreductase family protein [Acidimicrobiaceae bacterium]|nr:nitroreductase family protein [Acidimicrobiaceae bacterium]